MQLNNAVLQYQKVGSASSPYPVSVSLLSSVVFIDGDEKISNLNMPWGCVTNCSGVGREGTGELSCSVAEAALGLKVLLFQLSLCWGYRYLSPCPVSLKISESPPLRV